LNWDVLAEDILKSRKIKHSSLGAYLSSLRAIQSKLAPDDKPRIIDAKFLDDHKAVLKAIADCPITTRKNRLTAILVALRSSKPVNEELCDVYSKHLTALNSEYMDFLKQQKKTPVQKANWIEYDQLLEVSNNLLNNVKEINLDSMKGRSLPRKAYNTLQEYVAIRTYLTFPLRNDFADMPVLSSKAFAALPKAAKASTNYLVIYPKGRKRFHISNFKNVDRIGPKVLDIPPKLSKIINAWLHFNKSGFFLTKTNGSDPLDPNGITRLFNRIFKREVDKRISTSMMRHIIISHSLRHQPTLEEVEAKRREIENRFFHSPGINQLYRKVDAEQPSLPSNASASVGRPDNLSV
jgi:hypothetical protein